MGYLNAKQTMDRIEVATPDSPIAVFRSNKPGLLESVYAATSTSRAILQGGHLDLIGVFDRSMNPAPIFQTLRRQANKPTTNRQHERRTIEN